MRGPDPLPTTTEKCETKACQRCAYSMWMTTNIHKHRPKNHGYCRTVWLPSSQGFCVNCFFIPHLVIEGVATPVQPELCAILDCNSTAWLVSISFYLPSYGSERKESTRMKVLAAHMAELIAIVAGAIVSRAF